MVPVNNPGGGDIYNPVAGLAEGSEGLLLLEVILLLVLLVIPVVDTCDLRLAPHPPISLSC